MKLEKGGAMNKPRRMRVLFVDHETRLSGGEQDLVDLIGALDHDEVEVHAAIPGSGPLTEALVKNGVAVHLFRMSERMRKLSRWSVYRAPYLILSTALAFAGATVRLTRLIKRTRPDVVHSNSMKAHFLAPIPCALLRVPLVWHMRDILDPSWIRRVLVVMGSIFPARIVCISEAATEPFGVSTRASSKVRVVYNGVDLTKFENVEPGPWRRKLGADNGEFLVGIVGQIAYWKGQDVFVRAAEKLATTREDVRFAVVGECLFPENEAAFADGLRDHVERSVLSNRVTWTGWVDSIEGLMAGLDVLVHASRLPEPFGRVVVEAMAAGTPVITTSVGAGPELVTRDAGRVIAPEDDDALAEALAEMAAEAGNRTAKSQKARDAAARFDIRVTAAGVMSVWAEVLS